MPTLLTYATAGRVTSFLPTLNLPVNSTPLFGRSESHMSWWTCWKYHFILPVWRSSATIEHVYRFSPAPREFRGAGFPVPTKSRPSLVLTIGDSQNAPPPNAVLPFPFLF